MSAILPNGTRNKAAASKYMIFTQLKRKAFMANSFPMDGRAILTDALMKGVRKEPTVATKRADLLTSTRSLDFQDRRSSI